ncbi:MAG: acyclic terpene utilization AtuA family protein [Caldithrix sp.]|nr:acyclic terpene utilization AtuA family protein [Caldithrix sp.]
MKDYIRIASGQGYWGDRFDAPYDQVNEGEIDYLVMDYLAELTMSIMQKQKSRNPDLGYAKDFIPLMDTLLPTLVEKNIRVITNAGGVNPVGCMLAMREVAERQGFRDLKIAAIYGDDILHQLDGLIASGNDLKNMETGKSLSSVRKQVTSANVYFGAKPVVEALQQGAHIIVTGRVTDTGITLAPMIHEFGWKNDEWDKLAAGVVGGHINECGAQASGGNFFAGWQDVPRMERIGFPIVEAYPDGHLIITKHESLGGLITEQTIKEQLVYELGDPREYITPDVVADFTTIELETVGKDRVKIKNIKGKPDTPYYKVSISYFDGYTCIGNLTYTWPDALKKAHKADEIVRKRIEYLGLKFDEIQTEFLGYNASHGTTAHKIDDPNEIVFQIGVRGRNKADMQKFANEIVPLVLTGPPNVTGFGGGRPRVRDVIAYWPALISKEMVSPKVLTIETG